MWFRGKRHFLCRRGFGFLIFLTSLIRLASFLFLLLFIQCDAFLDPLSNKFGLLFGLPGFCVAFAMASASCLVSGEGEGLVFMAVFIEKVNKGLS